LQYEVFCKRVKFEIDKMISALSKAGIPSMLRFDAVGEVGCELVKMFEDNFSYKLGGEAILRIDDRYVTPDATNIFCYDYYRHALRLTLLSPSSLTAHLPQATLAISSIPQLGQLLSDEIEQCLLERICEIGSELCLGVGGTWFVDLVASRSVGRWEGCVVYVNPLLRHLIIHSFSRRNFRVYYGEGFSLHCSSSRLDREGGRRGTFPETYVPENRMPILLWVDQIINRALSRV
jgi:mediator of RNA polymerase II transcription subunit 17